MYVGRMHRMLRLITLLRSGRSWSANGLAAELRVTRRTLFRDLKTLDGAGIPYKFERRAGRYGLVDARFLPPLHLTLDECLALLLITRRLLQREIHPAMRTAVDAAVKIENLIPPSLLDHCGRLLERVEVRWPPASVGDGAASMYQRIELALAQRRRVRIRYRSLYEGETIETTLSPYTLLFRLPGWYVVGHSSLHGEVRTFKLDRIARLETTHEYYEPDPSFSIDAHFGRAWRMIPEGRIYRVRLLFEPKVAQNVAEVMWHSAQRTRLRPDGRLEFEVEVDGLSEIAWWVLGYGDQVRVLEPKALRERQTAAARAILAQYGTLRKVEA